MNAMTHALRADAAMHDAHDHAHDGHNHGHHHGHGAHHHHHHDHSHAGLRAHGRPEAPRFSLMRLSAAQRLGAAAVLIGLLWASVWWALQ